jgi:hypothetical protein
VGVKRMSAGRQPGGGKVKFEGVPFEPQSEHSKLESYGRVISAQWPFQPFEKFGRLRLDSIPSGATTDGGAGGACNRGGRAQVGIQIVFARMVSTLAGNIRGVRVLQ